LSSLRFVIEEDNKRKEEVEKENKSKIKTIKPQKINLKYTQKREKIKGKTKNKKFF
jgi:hypothetical protein